MLVLSRKVGESIVISNDVVLTVLEVRGEQVRLGIVAPRAVSVHRKEVHDELVGANRDAAVSRDVDLTRLPAPG